MAATKHQVSYKRQIKGNNWAKFALLGFCFGVLFPIVGMVTLSYHEFGELTWSNFWKAQTANPLLWIIDTAPLFLGLLAGYGGLQLDHIEQKNLELEERYDQMNELRRMADEGAKARSIFLTNVSHELRTPMNAIVGLSYLALKGELDDKQRDCITKIQENSESLMGVIDEVLDYSKIDAGEMRLSSIDFELDEMMEDIVESVKVKLKFKKNVQLDYEYDKRIPNILNGDPIRLYQLLTNLIDNAVKFTAEGIISIKTKLEVDEKEGVTLRFVVSDTGIGLSQEQIEGLFSPFSKGDNTMTRKYGGAGLGLTISKRLIDMMGGAIEIESKPGEGSTFSIILDFGKEIEGFRNIRASKIKRSNNQKSRNLEYYRAALGGLKVLIVDDNDINLELAEEVLRDVGIITSVARDGKEAVDEVKDNDYDGVLMDIQMPVMDGITATRKIREIQWLKELPIIALTAHSGAEEREKSMMAGMNDHLSKPIDPDLLYQSLSDHMNTDKARNRVMLVPVEKTIMLNEKVVIPNIDGVNIEEGLARTGNKPDLYKKILIKYCKTNKALLEKIPKLLMTGEFDELSKELHNLGGVSGNIGATAIYTRALEISRSIRAGASEDVWFESAQFLKEELERLILNIDLQLEDDVPQAKEKKSISEDDLKLKLKELISVVEDYDPSALELIEKITERYTLDDDKLKVLSAVHDHLDNMDFDQALDALKTLVSI